MSLAASALVVALALAGCGGGKQLSASTTTAADESASTTKGKTTTTKAESGDAFTNAELTEALLADADLPGFTVDASESASSDNAEFCDGQTVDLIEQLQVESKISKNDQNEAEQALASASASEMKSLFAKAKKVFTSCNAKTWSTGSSTIALTTVKAPDLGDDAIAFDAKVTRDAGGPSGVAHFIVLRVKNVAVLVVGLDGRGSTFSAADTKQLATKAVNKVKETLF